MPFLCDAADFDGTNDYQTFAGALTGLADGKQGTFSCWFRMDGGDNATQRFFSLVVVGNRFVVSRFSTNVIRIVGVNAAGANILQIESTGTVIAGATWHHFAASWDLADANKRHLYLDGVSDLAVTTYTDDTIDYASASVSRIGALGSDASGKFNGCLAEMWFDDTYVDLSANLTKFRSASGFPVSLGSDGSTPTGSSPVVYCHLDDGEAVANFALNRGTGEDFTITGALDTASTSPSDGSEQVAASSASSGASALRRKPETWSLRVDGEVLIFHSFDAVLAFIQTYRPKAEVRAEVKAERDAKRILRMGRSKANPAPPKLQVSATGEAKQFVDEVQARIDRLYWKALADALAREAEEIEDMKFIAEIL